VIVQARPFDDLTPDQILLWRRLQHADTDSPFLSPGFTRAVAAVRDDVEVAVMQQNGHTVGFLPFHRCGPNTGRPIGMRLSDFQGAVVDPGADWEADGLLRGAGLTSLHFDNLLASQRPLQRFHWGEAVSPFIDLSEGFDAYRAQRRRAGSLLVSQGLRKARKLAREVGPIRFELHTSERSVFETLVRWKSEQRRLTGTFNVLEVDWVLALLDRLRAESFDDVRGALSAMWVGDRLAAAHLGLRNDHALHFWFPGFERSLSRYSPGLVMVLEMMKACADQGVTRIHLGRGVEQFKLGLMTGGVRLATGSVQRSVSSWVLGSAWYRTRQWLRASPLRSAVQVPRRILRNWQHREAMR
jgi:CelD/BcsL family acetyltransferase involved in cellulose biosynthesis